MILGDHLVAVAGGEWAFWRWVAVRGAGLDSTLPATLGMPGVAACADAVLRLDADADRARLESIATLEAQLRAASGHERRSLADVVRRLKARTGRGEPLAGATAPASLPALRAAEQRLSDAWETFRHEFTAAEAATADALECIAALPRFREAVVWQNRRVLDTAVEPLLRRRQLGEPRNAKQRNHEELLASYVQRYCLKNDTIGFFGPVGWATWHRDGPAFEMRPGGCLVAERNTYFEPWCIDAYAQALARDPRFEPWMSPRRAANIALEAGGAVAPNGSVAALGEADVRLLHACDGQRSIRQIAKDLAAGGTDALEAERQVLERLRKFQQWRIVTLGFAVPSDLHPEVALADQLDHVEDDALRREALDGLHALCSAKEEVAKAAGAPEALNQAIAGLERTFVDLTGREATRAPGRTYAGRTLVFEDCRRDIEMRLGPAVLDALAPPLTLLLLSARWLTCEAARRFLAHAESVHGSLAAAAGSRGVSMAMFLERSRTLLLDKQSPLVLESVAAMQQRWAGILRMPQDCGSVHYSSAALESRVREMFDAPVPGWQSAAYHSPDLMIAAADAADVARGDCLFVLGELHPASNTIGTAGFLAQHPCEHEVRRAAALDLPEPRLEPIFPKDYWPSARTRPSLIAAHDYRIEVADCAGVDPRSIPVASLLITREGDRLVTRTRDGRLQFDFMAAVAQMLSLQVGRHFAVAPAAPHTPRITIDRLVVVRESWSFAPEALTCAWGKDEAERFVAVRRWARGCGLPRHLFVKAPCERKPFYVDLDSPIFVGLLTKAIRRSAESGPADGSPAAGSCVTFSEMLPGPDQCWLTDADGVRYTSELRMVAVDLSGRRSRPVVTGATSIEDAVAAAGR